MTTPALATAHATFAARARAFGEVHARADSRRFAANLTTRIVLLEVDGLVLPATVNNGADIGNTWVCSPQTTYCAYAIEELRRYLPPMLAAPLIMLCKVYGLALQRARLDRAVAVNNWMLSTNLYPRLDGHALDAVIEQVRTRWPDHAVWFRSLNAGQNAQLIDLLRARGFSLVPSRQVYVFDLASPRTTRSADFRRDMRLLRTTALRRVGAAEFGEADFGRIAELYAELYIAKYSGLNPRYTAEFFRAWHRSGLLEFHGFRDADGVLQGVVGTFRQGDTITAPVVGYNTGLPARLGLYRLLMAAVFDHAQRCGCVVNLSAGAAGFKRLRGGQPAIEYSAVYARHLPLYRRSVITVLRVLTTWIAEPLMKKLKL